MPNFESELSLELPVYTEEGRAVAAINRMRLRLVRPEMSPDEMLRSFEAHGLMETATVLAPHIESI